MSSAAWGSTSSPLSKLDTTALPAAEQKELCARAKKGDVAARDRLVQHTLSFVWGVANRHATRCRTHTAEDLVSEGVCGVLKAIEKFDPTMGFNFITYASSRIISSIARVAAIDQSAAYIPHHRMEKIVKIGKRRRELEKQQLDAAEIDELLRHEFGDDNMEATAAVRSEMSMDANFGHDGSEMTLHDVLQAEGVDIDETRDVSDLRARVRATIAPLRPSLSRLAIAVLDQRLLAEQPQTLEEVAAPFGLTRERARQVEVKTLQRVARELRRKMPRDVLAELSSVQHGPRRQEIASTPWRPAPDAPKPMLRAPAPVRRIAVSASGVRVGDVAAPVTTKRRVPFRYAEPKGARTTMTDPKSEGAPLTERQRKVAELATAGMRPKQIARELRVDRSQIDATLSALRRRGLLTVPPTKGPNRAPGIEGLGEKQRACVEAFNAGAEIDGVMEKTGQSRAACADMLRNLWKTGHLNRDPFSIGLGQRVANGRGKIAAGTTEEAILRVLADGKEHPLSEIHRLSGLRTTYEAVRQALAKMALRQRAKKVGRGMWQRVDVTPKTNETTRVGPATPSIDERIMRMFVGERPLIVKEVATQLVVNAKDVADAFDRLETKGSVWNIGRGTWMRAADAPGEPRQELPTPAASVQTAPADDWLRRRIVKMLADGNAYSVRDAAKQLDVEYREFIAAAAALEDDGLCHSYLEHGRSMFRAGSAPQASSQLVVAAPTPVDSGFGRVMRGKPELVPPAAPARESERPSGVFRLPPDDPTFRHLRERLAKNGEEFEACTARLRELQNERTTIERAIGVLEGKVA